MALMAWSDDLSLGNEHMDSQHKDIIRLMNMLSKYQWENVSSIRGLSVLLLKLRIVLARHFIEEEYLLEQNGCPWFEEHAVDHAYIIKKISETDAMELNEIINRRIPMLQELLESHIAIHDVECRGYFSV